jgi:hypothetical protein
MSINYYHVAGVALKVITISRTSVSTSYAIRITGLANSTKNRVARDA